MSTRFVMQGLGLAACPESPIWLDWTGRGSAAHKARQKLLGAAAGSLETVAPAAPDAGSSDEAMLPLHERPSETGSLTASEQVWAKHCLYAPPHQTFLIPVYIEHHGPPTFDEQTCAGGNVHTWHDIVCLMFACHSHA